MGSLRMKLLLSSLLSLIAASAQAPQQEGSVTESRLEVDWSWSSWTRWTQCSAQCGGEQLRVRFCNDPRPDGDLPCPGDQIETRICNRGIQCQGPRMVTPTFGFECSQDRVCVTESSCPYWVERKARWRKGQDNTYRSDRRNQVCNTQLRALCCPKPVQGVTRRPILTESPGNTALIITGGYNGDDWLSSVEVYHPGTNTSCTLPSLPEKIRSHSQDGLVLCGGYPDSGSSCYTLDPNTGQWTKTHSLSERREGHSS